MSHVHLSVARSHQQQQTGGLKRYATLPPTPAGSTSIETYCFILLLTRSMAALI